MGYCRYLRFELLISYLHEHQQRREIILTSLFMSSNVSSSSKFFCTSCEAVPSVHHIVPFSASIRLLHKQDGICMSEKVIDSS